MKIGLWAPAQARRTLPLLTLALAASFETLADNGASRFDLPPQALAATLEQLAKSTGTKLIYADAVVQGLSAEALRGQFTIGQALEKVLSKNGLQYETVGDGMIAIKKPHHPNRKQSTTIRFSNSARSR